MDVSASLTLFGLLEREPSHGYDLKRDYDTLFGRGKQLSFGQEYATLGRLRDGIVSSVNLPATAAFPATAAQSVN
jgi:DNA-binding PadR family transcriptional regulator